MIFLGQPPCIQLSFALPNACVLWGHRFWFVVNLINLSVCMWHSEGKTYRGPWPYRGLYGWVPGDPILRTVTIVHSRGKNCFSTFIFCLEANIDMPWEYLGFRLSHCCWAERRRNKSDSKYPRLVCPTRSGLTFIKLKFLDWHPRWPIHNTNIHPVPSLGEG